MFNDMEVIRMPKKKEWSLFEGRHAYKDKRGVFVDPEIAELASYWKKKKKGKR